MGIEASAIERNMANRNGRRLGYIDIYWDSPIPNTFSVYALPYMEWWRLLHRRDYSDDRTDEPDVREISQARAFRVMVNAFMSACIQGELARTPGANSSVSTLRPPRQSGTETREHFMTRYNQFLSTWRRRTSPVIFPDSIESWRGEYYAASVKVDWFQYYLPRTFQFRLSALPTTSNAIEFMVAMLQCADRMWSNWSVGAMNEPCGGPFESSATYEQFSNLLAQFSNLFAAQAIAKIAMQCKRARTEEFRTNVHRHIRSYYQGSAFMASNVRKPAFRAAETLLHPQNSLTAAAFTSALASASTAIKLVLMGQDLTTDPILNLVYQAEFACWIAGVGVAMPKVLSPQAAFAQLIADSVFERVADYLLGTTHLNIVVDGPIGEKMKEPCTTFIHEFIASRDATSASDQDDDQTHINRIINLVEGPNGFIRAIQDLHSNVQIDRPNAIHIAMTIETKLRVSFAEGIRFGKVI